MDRAFRWTKQHGTRLSGDYPALRNQILTTPAQVDLPPLVLSRLDVDAIRAQPTLVSESAAALEEKEFRTWFFDAGRLGPYLEALLQAKDSPIVLSPAQQQERFRVTVEKAVEEIFGGATKQSWVRRLYTMAYCLAATNRQEAARQACAAALALDASARGGRDIALCEQLVRVSLASLFQRATEQEKERAQSSLILTPQQAAQRRRLR
jgi:hypothetical protein